MHEFFLTVLCFTLKKIYGTIDFPVVKDINKNGARSIQPKFPEISVQGPQHERDVNTSRNFELIQETNVGVAHTLTLR